MQREIGRVSVCALCALFFLTVRGWGPNHAAAAAAAAPAPEAKAAPEPTPVAKAAPAAETVPAGPAKRVAAPDEQAYQRDVKALTEKIDGLMEQQVRHVWAHTPTTHAHSSFLKLPVRSFFHVVWFSRKSSTPRSARPATSTRRSAPRRRR